MELITEYCQIHSNVTEYRIEIHITTIYRTVNSAWIYILRTHTSAIFIAYHIIYFVDEI